MGFSRKYIQQFITIAESICSEYQQQYQGEIYIGQYITCPYPPEAIIKVMDVWVTGIDKLIGMTEEIYDGMSRSKFTSNLYAQRCISYDEFYYLFSSNIDEKEYLNTPAYIFTRTFSKEIRDRKFKQLTYSPETYMNFVLSFDTVPSQFFLQQDRAILPKEFLSAHSYCVAKTRSGKTELLKVFIYNLIQKKDSDTSLLILDPHGEMARELRRLSIVGADIKDMVYLDPTIDSDHTPVFNPFEVTNKDIGTLAYSSDNILDAFQQLLKDQIITGNMKRLLRHCIFALLHEDDTNMMDLLILLSAINRNRSKRNPEFSQEEQRLFQCGLNAPDPITRRFFDFGWKEVDARTVNAVVERVDSILSHPLVRRFIVGKNSFDLETLLNRGKIVIVNLDFTKLGNIGSESIGRLIVSQAQNISAGRNRIQRHQRPKTIIFMDECQRFVSAAIERALSEFAKFNTYLFLSHQYIEQIDDGMAKAMLSNTENKIVGRNSAASLGSISSDIGIPSEDLLKVKKYQFYIKAGDRDAFLFQGADFLLDAPESNFFISESEAQESIDKYMIKKYYRPIHAFNNKTDQNKDFQTETSGFSVDLEESDF